MRVKARYLKGVLTPLDPPLDLEEGAVVELEVVASHPWSLDWAISEAKEDLERICRLPDNHPKKYKLFLNAEDDLIYLEGERELWERRG